MASKYRASCITVVIAIIFAALSGSVSAQVNKCKAADGRYVYSDLPCPATTNKVDEPNMTNAASQRYQGRDMFDSSPLPKIDFGGTPFQRFTRARAMIASIKIDARECDWDMKVTKRFIPCAKFLQQMVEGREWQQATTEIGALMGDDQFTAENRLEVEALLRDMKEILKIKELAVVRAR